MESAANPTKVKYQRTSSSLQALRQSSPSIFPSNSVGFGMDVNTSNQTYTLRRFWPTRQGQHEERALQPDRSEQAGAMQHQAEVAPPVGLWLGHVYLGKAWMKVSISSASAPLSALIMFGTPSFSGN
jgi:hypothetical protein